MITNNFKTILSLIYISNGTSNTNGFLPLKDVSGTTRYMGAGFNSFPFTITNNVQISIDNAGIHIGAGTKEESENDYSLDNKITSGISASTPATSMGIDNDGNPFKKILFTLTNTTNNDILVSEIGYFQNFAVSNALNQIANTFRAFMIDRTVLDNPVTVPANGSAVIEYTLKTIASS